MKRFTFLFLFLSLVACGDSSDAADAGDAASEHYGHKDFDASSGYDAPEAEAAAKVPFDRMTNHGGSIIATPRIRLLYVGVTKNFDSLVTWMLESKTYWSVVAQYGVGPGALVGSEQLDEDTFFQAGDIQGGVIGAWTLGARIHAAIASLPPAEGGAANAYVVFLPGGLIVDLGGGKTCTWALGYHSHDGEEPYSVIPGCGASGWTLSHEIAEMVTDALPGEGWYSEADFEPAGGEIGDLCNFPVDVEGNLVSALWSNADGDCEPSQ